MTMKQKIKMKLQKFRSWFDAKLAGLNRECLTALLVACGIVACVVIAIAIATKALSTMALVLAALGLAAVIAIWDRLRSTHTAPGVTPLTAPGQKSL